MTTVVTFIGLRIDLKDGVAVVTMCNGDNKFTLEYVHEWNKVLDYIDSNDEIKALVTTGEGRSFSTGLDVTWIQNQGPRMLDQYHEELHALYRRIMSLGVVTVAVINGHAIAECGFIALMHDYRVMRSDRGWIQWPEIHLKLPFTQTMLHLFSVKVPLGPAHREALVFGKRLDANTAKKLGIVDAIATPDNMMDVAMETITSALGKMKITRGFFNDMKTDIFTACVPDEQMSSKL